MSRLRCFLPMLVIAAILTSCGKEDSSNPVIPTYDINEYMANLPSWGEFSPEDQERDGPVGNPYNEAQLFDDKIYICSVTPCSITENPEEIVTYDPDSEILYMGSLIQGKTYVEGLGSMGELPIRQRAPLTISIDLLFPDNNRTVENPDLASVKQAIGELITAAVNAGHLSGSSISYGKTVSHSLDQAMLKLGLSVKYMGTSVHGQLETESNVEQTTVAANFVQKMFTVSTVLPQTPADFFSSDLTQEIIDKQISLGRLGPDNLPVFVSNIVYGRIMVLTMTSYSEKDSLLAAIKASHESIGGGSIETEFLNILDKSEIKVVTVGGDAQSALNLLKSGNLTDYFADDAPLTTAKPISYTLRNLADNSIAKVSETTTYNIQECSSAQFAYFSSEQQWRAAVLGITGGQVVELDTDKYGVLKANEVSTLGNEDNEPLGPRLTFARANTGLPIDFYLEALNLHPTQPEYSLVFNDNEIDDGYRPSISVGDVDNQEDDDFEIVITGKNSDCGVIAIGIFVGDNRFEPPDEWLEVYGVGGKLLGMFTDDLPHCSSNCFDYIFMGVVAPEPITRFIFEEDPGADDMCIRNFRFGLLYYP